MWLGCDGAGGLPAGMGARGVDSPLPLVRLRLTIASVMWSLSCGCVWLCLCLSDGVVHGVLVYKRGFGSWVRWVCFSGPECWGYCYSLLPVGLEHCHRDAFVLRY